MPKLPPEQSLEVCGLSEPLAFALQEGRLGLFTHKVLPQSFVLVGSLDGADLHLAGSEVSTRHVYLQVVAGRLFGIDLDSRTGTRWASGTGSHSWVSSGDSFAVGSSLIRLEKGPSTGAVPGEDNPLVAGSCRAYQLAPVQVDVSQEGKQDVSWCMDRMIALVGRSAFCKVRLWCASVSRVHCSLVRTPHGVLVVDLGGRGGVQVNGERVRVALLTDSDRVQIGTIHLRVREVLPVSVQSSAGVIAVQEVSALPESYLPELLRQFATMQQQMFEHFLQTLQAVLSVGAVDGERRPMQAQETAELLRELQKRLEGAPTGRSPHLLENLLPGEVAAGNRALLPRPQTASTGGKARHAVALPTSENGQVPADMHSLLCERIKNLEQEQQGIWKKMLDFVLRC